MRLLRLARWISGLMLAIAVAHSTASAQEADSLSISGQFNMDELRGIVGADLADVFARANEHWWLLTLYDITSSQEAMYNSLGCDYDEQLITRLHATSFDFQFFGPDADVLNEVVSQQLTKSSLGDDVFLELRNIYCSFSRVGDEAYATWELGLLPVDPATGVSFAAGHGYHYPFPTDENGYPLVEPLRVTSEQTVIADRRPGSLGELVSIADVVDIGSPGPPNLPPILNIGDGSVLEGDRGTSRLVLTVTLSRNSNDVVTVDYQTSNGSALATRDYYSTRDTLTLWPGETSRTIEISIRTDRKREADETFYVELVNADGATINDAVGTATILNDD